MTKRWCPFATDVARGQWPGCDLACAHHHSHVLGPRGAYFSQTELPTSNNSLVVQNVLPFLAPRGYEKARSSATQLLGVGCLAEMRGSQQQQQQQQREHRAPS